MIKPKQDLAPDEVSNSGFALPSHNPNRFGRLRFRLGLGRDRFFHRGGRRRRRRFCRGRFGFAGGDRLGLGFRGLGRLRSRFRQVGLSRLHRFRFFCRRRPLRPGHLRGWRFRRARSRRGRFHRHRLAGQVTCRHPADTTVPLDPYLNPVFRFRDLLHFFVTFQGGHLGAVHARTGAQVKAGGVHK